MADAAGITRLLWTSLLDLVFPPRCQCCLKFCAFPICPECLTRFHVLSPPFCERCGMAFDPKAKTGALCGDCREGRFRLEKARAAFHYREAAREAIHALKYRGRTRLAEPLGTMMSDRFPDLFPAVSLDGLIPIPLHKRRERQRGFNQARLLAEQLSRHHGLEVWNGVLVRSRATRPQVELTARQREGNVRGAFQVADPDRIAGRRVLLIDDMFTTGSTMSECCRTLLKAGAAGVLGYTLARG